MLTVKSGQPPFKSLTIAIQLENARRPKELRPILSGMTATFSAELLGRVPEEAQNKAGICAECVPG